MAIGDILAGLAEASHQHETNLLNMAHEDRTQKARLFADLATNPNYSPEQQAWFGKAALAHATGAKEAKQYEIKDGQIKVPVEIMQPKPANVEQPQPPPTMANGVPTGAEPYTLDAPTPPNSIVQRPVMQPMSYAEMTAQQAARAKAMAEATVPAHIEQYQATVLEGKKSTLAAHGYKDEADAFAKGVRVVPDASTPTGWRAEAIPTAQQTTQNQAKIGETTAKTEETKAKTIETQNSKASLLATFVNDPDPAKRAAAKQQYDLLTQQAPMSPERYKQELDMLNKKAKFAEALKAQGSGSDIKPEELLHTTGSSLQYVDANNFTGAVKNKVLTAAAHEGLAIPDKDTVGHLRSIDIARDNSNYMLELVESKLPRDAAGRILQGPANKIGELAQTDPVLGAIGTFRVAAIQQIQALSSGPGMRINQAEIQQAMENDIPRDTDTLDTARQRVINLQKFLTNAEKTFIGGSKAIAGGAGSGGTSAGFSFVRNGETLTFPTKAAMEAAKKAVGVK